MDDKTLHALIENQARRLEETAAIARKTELSVAELRAELRAVSASLERLSNILGNGQGLSQRVATVEAHQCDAAERFRECQARAERWRVWFRNAAVSLVVGGGLYLFGWALSHLIDG